MKPDRNVKDGVVTCLEFPHIYTNILPDIVTCKKKNMAVADIQQFYDSDTVASRPNNDYSQLKFFKYNHVGYYISLYIHMFT